MSSSQQSRKDWRGEGTVTSQSFWVVSSKWNESHSPSGTSPQTTPQPECAHCYPSIKLRVWETTLFPTLYETFMWHFISNNLLNHISSYLKILHLGACMAEFLFLWLPAQSTFQNCHGKTMIKMSQLSIIQVPAHLTFFPPFIPPPAFCKALSDLSPYTAFQGRQTPLLLKMPNYWTNFLPPLK